MRAKAKVITEISARSRKPTRVVVSILSSNARASSAVSTGVLPRRTTCFGPRTECAGFIATTWPAALIDGGATIEAVAARFGVSERHVRQRLKLGKLAPELLDAFRAGAVSLDVIM